MYWNEQFNSIFQKVDNENQVYTREFNDKLENHIMQRLCEMGYEIMTKKDLYDFCRKRVQSFTQSEPYSTKRTYYIDYADYRRRKLIGGYIEESILITYPGVYRIQVKVDYF